MIWILFFALPVFVLLLNLYYRNKTISSLEQDFNKLNWKNLPREKYIKKSYTFLSNKFDNVKRCWLIYPWRNFYYRNLWKTKNLGLPCHMQNFLLQKFLLKKMKRNDIKTIITSMVHKRMFVHVYSKVKIKGKWTDVDVWGKKRGIPFGKSVHDFQEA